MKNKMMRKLLYVFPVVVGICVSISGCGLQEAKTEQTSIMEDSSDKEENDTVQESNSDDFSENLMQEEDVVETEPTDNSKNQNTASEKETEQAEEVSENTEGLLENQVDWINVIAYEEPVVLYAQSIVNVRKGPDTSFDVLGTLSTNDQVEVIGEYAESKWMEVIYQGEKAFVSGRYLGEEQIDLAALQAQEEAVAMAAIEADVQKREETENVASKEVATEDNSAPPYIASPAGVVFVGDSRCVQMSAAVGGGGSTWICENSKRYSWFESYAVPRLDNIVGKGTKVVICMGVNDPWDYNQYAALANQRAAEWAARGATTYFVSVNPVWENPYVTQEQVDTFNANMPGLLNGVRWIDTASIVKQGGYKLVDGLHYDTNAYINIFNLICGSL